jgi:HTH-type transcriptional regulator/antitoxin HigA
VARFSKDKVKTGLTALRRLAAYPEETRKAPRLLADMGIRFVIVEHLPKTKMDGAALLPVAGNPVIALSLRFDRIDYFWHTLMHEVSHILHDEPMLDINLYEALPNGDRRVIEERADREAANALIPADELNDFIIRVGPLYSKQRIKQFANHLKIHPGIVVGQLQYRREIDWRANREMLVPMRDIVIQEALTDGWGHTVTER